MLVGVVLLVFQLTRDSGPVLQLPAAPGRRLSPRRRRRRHPPCRRSQPPNLTPAAEPDAGAPRCARPRGRASWAAWPRSRLTLGASMGEPLECERAIDDQGNTQQKTTTGLAYYRSKLNIACFTTGWDHWGTRARPGALDRRCGRSAGRRGATFRARVRFGHGVTPNMLGLPIKRGEDPRLVSGTAPTSKTSCYLAWCTWCRAQSARACAHRSHRRIGGAQGPGSPAGPHR